MKITPWYILSLLFFWGTHAHLINAENDFQTWQWLTAHVYEKDGLKAHLYADNRIADNSTRERLYILGPRIHYRAQEHLSVGLGYLNLNIHDLKRDIWSKEHRFENELNFHFTLSKRWNFHHRNRLEWRWREALGERTMRTRSRIQFRYRTGMRVLESVYFNNEFFWDHRTDDFSENRCIPIGLEWNLTPRTDLNLFYMIQSVHASAQSSWTSNHIFGTHLIFKF